MINITNKYAGHEIKNVKHHLKRINTGNKLLLKRKIKH